MIIAKIHYVCDGVAEIEFLENVKDFDNVSTLDILQDMISDLQAAYNWLLENRSTKSNLSDYFEKLGADSPHFKIHTANFEIHGDHFYECNIQTKNKKL